MEDFLMRQIDDGPTDGPRGPTLRTAWVTLTTDEARQLMESLQVWAEAAADGISDPGWHIHITDTDGNELTIAIGSEAGR
jgi:hypothetical protein